MNNFFKHLSGAIHTIKRYVFINCQQQFFVSLDSQ